VRSTFFSDGHTSFPNSPTSLAQFGRLGETPEAGSALASAKEMHNGEKR